MTMAVLVAILTALSPGTALAGRADDPPATVSIDNITKGPEPTHGITIRQYFSARRFASGVDFLQLSFPPELGPLVRQIISDGVRCDIHGDHLGATCGGPFQNDQYIEYDGDRLAALLGGAASRTFTVRASWDNTDISASGTVTVRGSADLSLGRFAQAHNATLGDVIEFTVHNDGPTISRNTTVTISGFGPDHGDSTTIGCRFSGSSLVCSYGELAMTDGTQPRHIVALDPGWRSRRYTAKVSGLYADPNNGNNSASFGPTGGSGGGGSGGGGDSGGSSGGGGTSTGGSGGSGGGGGTPTTSATGRATPTASSPTGVSSSPSSVPTDSATTLPTGVGVDTRPLAAAPTARTGLGAWWWLVVAIVVALAAGLAYVLMRRRRPSTEDAPEDPATA